MGVRYNAAKREAGAYHSTKIWEFNFKCHLCKSKSSANSFYTGPNWICIQTDPRNTAYKIIHGAREKQETWDPVENGSHVLESAADKKRLETDAFFKLEKTTKDIKDAKVKKHGIEKLLGNNDRTWSDPYTLNCSLRKRLRVLPFSSYNRMTKRL
jgi:coiled-coil domain-containing protein 130